MQHESPRVLIVDDDPGMRAFLKTALLFLASATGEACDAQRGLEAIESGAFDLVLCDINMPGASGLDFLRIAQQSHWDVGMILITGYPDTGNVIEALRLDAFDFLLKPFAVQQLAESIARSYRRLKMTRDARAVREYLEAGIRSRTQELETALNRLESNFDSTLEVLVAALDAREHETSRHSHRVRAYTMHLARLINYPPALLPELAQAALLHDIGKIAVPDSILLKPGSLTRQEWIEMQAHPVAGERILDRIAFLRPAARIIRHHHERFDGTGYPDGLRGEHIPLGARLFALADSLDAITSDRSYRKAEPFERASAVLEKESGKQFDPRLLHAFCRVPVETWQKLRAQVEAGSSAFDAVNAVV